LYAVSWPLNKTICYAVMILLNLIIIGYRLLSVTYTKQHYYSVLVWYTDGVMAQPILFILRKLATWLQYQPIPFSKWTTIQVYLFHEFMRIRLLRTNLLVKRIVGLWPWINETWTSSHQCQFSKRTTIRVWLLYKNKIFPHRPMCWQKLSQVLTINRRNMFTFSQPYNRDLNFPS